ncbi:MAG: hypothetical protein KIS66_09860 [Fimbriimonadaceae bacterium]|nr:hypothetical protein [Fimbriimonadaceae bacterium]
MLGSIGETVATFPKEPLVLVGFFGIKGSRPCRNRSGFPGLPEAQTSEVSGHMKKIFAILLAVAALGVVVSGCQQGGGDAEKPADTKTETPKAEGS